MSELGIWAKDYRLKPEQDNELTEPLAVDSYVSPRTNSVLTKDSTIKLHQLQRLDSSLPISIHSSEGAVSCPRAVIRGFNVAVLLACIVIVR